MNDAFEVKMPKTIKKKYFLIRMGESEDNFITPSVVQHELGFT